MTTAERAYVPPSVMLREYLADPIRGAIVLGVTIVLGYGVRRGLGSPLSFRFMEPFAGTVSAIELIIITVVLVEFFRRIVLDDFSIERSPLSRPMWLVGLTMCVIPYVRMVFTEGGIRVPYEIMFLPAAVATFFIWKFVFRRQELMVMVWIVLACGLYKLFEGVLLFLTSTVGWGLLTGWRDAMLITMIVLGGFFAFIIRPDPDDEVYRRVRSFLMWVLPLAVWVTMLSMRRTYMVGAMVSIPALFFFIPRRERRRATAMLVAMFLLGTASLAITGAGMFFTRMTGLVEPTTEGSAAYRLLETYNAIQMVKERPIVGWPMGASARNYTNIDFNLVSALIPHDIYLYMMLRGGIFGLASWLLVIGTACLIAYRALRAARTSRERFLALWLSSSVILLIMAGFTTPLVGDRNHYFFPFILVMLSYLPGVWGRERRALPQGKGLA